MPISTASISPGKRWKGWSSITGRCTGAAAWARSPAFDARWPLDLSSWPGLEAQIAALADDIAYVNHDIDDGLRAGHFHRRRPDRRAAGGRACRRRVMARYGELELSRFIGELIRTLMSALMDDVLAETGAQSGRGTSGSAAAVRGGRPGAGGAFRPRMLERAEGAEGLPVAPTCTAIPGSWPRWTRPRRW